MKYRVKCQWQVVTDHQLINTFPAEAEARRHCAALNAAAEPAKEKRFNYPLAPKRAHSMDDGTPLPD